MRVRSGCCGSAFEGGEGAPSTVHCIEEGAATDGGSGDGVYLPAVFRDGERSRGLHIEATHVTYAARLALLVVPLGDTRAEAWALGVLEDGEVYEASLGIEADHHTDEAAEALLRVALDGEADECATLLRGVDGEAVGLAFGQDHELLSEGIVVEGWCYGTYCLDLRPHLCLGDRRGRDLVDYGEDPRDQDADAPEREEHVGECRTELLHSISARRSASDGYTY